MRSTLDLIQELREEAARGRFTVVVLAVGFEKSTEFISSADPNPLEKLNAFITQGGEPIGFLGFTRLQGKKQTVETRLLDEYKHQSWAYGYLASLAAGFGAQVEAAGLGSVADNKH